MKQMGMAALAVGLLWGAQAQAQTVLTVSSWVPPKHLISLAQAEWCGELAKKTSNRVRCNILPKAPMPAPGTMPPAARRPAHDAWYSLPASSKLRWPAPA